MSSGEGKKEEPFKLFSCARALFSFWQRISAAYVQGRIASQEKNKTEEKKK